MRLVRILTGSIVSGLLWMSVAFAAPPALSDADRSFLEAAHQFELQQIAASHLATSKATTTHVQVFAKQMVEDHMKALEKLEKLAKSVGATVSQNMDDAHADKVKTLQKLSGSEFDRQYASDEVTQHSMAIELFEKASSSSANEEIKKRATKRLEHLRDNLQAAQAALSKL